MDEVFQHVCKKIFFLLDLSRVLRLNGSFIMYYYDIPYVPCLTLKRSQSEIV